MPRFRAIKYRNINDVNVSDTEKSFQRLIEWGLITLEYTSLNIEEIIFTQYNDLSGPVVRLGSEFDSQCLSI